MQQGEAKAMSGSAGEHMLDICESQSIIPNTAKITNFKRQGNTDWLML